MVLRADRKPVHVTISLGTEAAAEIDAVAARYSSNNAHDRDVSPAAAA
jgi:hypothetical protein